MYFGFIAFAKLSLSCVLEGSWSWFYRAGHPSKHQNDIKHVKNAPSTDCTPEVNINCKTFPQIWLVDWNDVSGPTNMLHLVKSHSADWLHHITSIHKSPNQEDPPSTFYLHFDECWEFGNTLLSHTVFWLLHSSEVCNWMQSRSNHVHCWKPFCFKRQKEILC